MEPNKPNKALLVMDMQAAFLGQFPNANAVVDAVTRAIVHARKNGIPVIYVTVGFRRGTPEISSNNKAFSAARQLFTSVSPEDLTQIHTAIAPAEGEVIVAKRRVSAFSGSDLAVLLSAYNTREIVLTGVATSGVVLFTLCEAADRDYGITVLADGCADVENDTHKVLTQKVFTRVANVITVEEWMKQ